jgi:hypothetical protein
MLTDMVIPADRSVAQKQAETKPTRGYVRLQGIWNMKCMIIPVVTGATGIVTKGLKKQLAAIQR